MFSLSAFTAAHGMDSEGSFCTDDSCKLDVAVSVTKAFYMTGLLTVCKTPQTWRTGRFFRARLNNFSFSVDFRLKIFL